MSHLRRYNTADAALAALALEATDSERPDVRLRTRLNEILEGKATAISADELTVIGRDSVAPRRIDFDAIEQIEVREPSRRREWIVAAAGVLITLSILVSTANTPVISRISEVDIFMLLYACAAGAAPFLLSRTPLGRWLRPWRTLYSNSSASGA